MTLLGSDHTTSHMSTGLPVIQYPLSTKSSTFVVAEGIPPVSWCLIEKVRKWEYVNLADLLKDHNSPDQSSMVRSYQRLIRNLAVTIELLAIFTPGFRLMTSSQPSFYQQKIWLKRKQQIWLPTVTWSLKCRKIYKALMAAVWSEFSWMAATSGIRKWGELNFSIYSTCLTTQQPGVPEL